MCLNKFLCWAPRGGATSSSQFAMCTRIKLCKQHKLQIMHRYTDTAPSVADTFIATATDTDTEADRVTYALAAASNVLHHLNAFNLF